jgi:hypothetical protein
LDTAKISCCNVPCCPKTYKVVEISWKPLKTEGKKCNTPLRPKKENLLIGIIKSGNFLLALRLKIKKK